MNPIRRHMGPDRRKTPDRRVANADAVPVLAVHDPEERSNRGILIAFWASVIVSVIIASSALWIAYKSNTAICVETKYLEGSARLTKLAADKTIDPQLKAARYKGAAGAGQLARELRAVVFLCGPAPRVTDQKGAP